MDDALGVTAFLAVSAGLKYLLHYRAPGKNSLPTNARQVGTLKCIRLFPCKSMGIIKPLQADCTFSGLFCQGVMDRQWVLVTAAGHKFITARAKPALVRVQPSIQGDRRVHLDADGMQTLKLSKYLPSEGANIVNTEVFGERIAGVDVGDEAAEWMERYLGKPAGTYRLLLHTPDIKKRVLVEQKDPWQKQCKASDSVVYQDGFPFMMIGMTSLYELSRIIQTRTGKPPGLSMDQFRPNFEVDGCRAFNEDTWQEIFIGDAKFSRAKQCDRCIMTTVDPALGEKRADGEPLNTLKKIRPFVDGSPTFGINLVLDRPGRVEVGQPVYATF